MFPLERSQIQPLCYLKIWFKRLSPVASNLIKKSKSITMFPVRFDSLFGLAKGRPDITADLSALKLPATESLKTSLAQLSKKYPGPPPAKIPLVVCGSQKACGMFEAKYNTAIDMAVACEVLSSTQIKIGTSNVTVYLVERKDDGKERAVYIGATIEEIKLKKQDHIGTSTKGDVLNLQDEDGLQKKRAGSALWPWKLSQDSLVAFSFGEPEVIDVFPKMYAAAQKAAGADAALMLYGHSISEKQMRGNRSVLGVKTFMPCVSKLADLHVQLESLPPQDLSLIHI